MKVGKFTLTGNRAGLNILGKVLDVRRDWFGLEPNWLYELRLLGELNRRAQARSLRKDCGVGQ